MPRKCLVCSHEQREAIDRALVAGETLAAIAALYCVSKDSVGRHKVKHLPASLALAKEAEEVAQADSLMEQVQYLQRKAMSILDRAEKAGDLRTALQAISAARGVLELLARITGEIETRTALNIVISPQWVELKGVILEVLAPHPEVQGELVKRLARSEGNGGE